MARSDYHIIVKHVSEDLVKCAVLGCQNDANDKKRLQADVPFLDKANSGHVLTIPMMFYLCNECFEEAKRTGNVSMPSYPQPTCHCSACTLARAINPSLEIK